MRAIHQWAHRAVALITRHLASWLPGLLMRLFIAWEFFEAGLEKFRGENWFDSIREDFPFPFNVLPTHFSWQLATGAELILPILLVLGLATRLSAIGLSVLTAVAWYAVHAGNGYNVADNGYKLTLIYSLILIALFAHGAGRLSVDHWLKCRKSGA